MKYVLLYIFLLSSPLIIGQTDSLRVSYDKANIEQKKFDTESIEKYRADKDFDYTEKKEEPGFFAKAWNWFLRLLTRFFEFLFGVEQATGALRTFLSILPYFLLAVVLYFLLKFFLKVDTNALSMQEQNKAIVNLTEEEELIKNQDLQQLIDKAIADKNYRLAIRYSYLAILQRLVHVKLIDWQQEKTNEDYIKEIERDSLRSLFSKSTLLYDFVWYGNFEIDELEFEKAQLEFKELHKLIA